MEETRAKPTFVWNQEELIIELGFCFCGISPHYCGRKITGHVGHRDAASGVVSSEKSTWEEDPFYSDRISNM